MPYCELCGDYFERITSTHLKWEHDITMDEYRSRYPTAELVSEEIREAISRWSSNREVSWETRVKLSLHRYANPVKNNPMLDFDKWSEISRKLWADPEYRKARAQDLKEFWSNPENREAARQKSLEQASKPGVREAASEKAKAQWRNPDYVKAMQESRHKKPNQDELVLQVLLSIYFPGEWKYVGDFDVIIGGKNPDFININGKKKVIELFSYHWHLEQARTEDDVADRINHYTQYGFDCLVLWTDEIYGNEVVDKVKEFANG